MALAQIEAIDAVADHFREDAKHISVMTIGDKKAVSEKIEGSTPGVLDKHRYDVGDLVVAVYERAILPDDVLQPGFWKDGKGSLSGKKGNRMKASNFKEQRSEFILFPVHQREDGTHFITRGDQTLDVKHGDDVTAFFGIEEFAG